MLRTSLATLLALLLSAAPAAAEFRLPQDVVPVFEAVHLRVDPDREDYSGRVRVELEVRIATDSLCFHAEDQELGEIRLTQSGRTIRSTTRSGPEGLRVLKLSPALARGAATLEVEFQRPIGTRSVGLYKTTQDGRGYVFTQFESTDGRKAFPCWDEPAFKIPWQVTLEVPEGQQAVTNTPLLTESSADGWRTLVHARTRPLPSYLIAVAVGPFEFTPVAGTSIPTRVVSPAGRSHLAARTVATTPGILSALERWFGRPYPYEKLDLIAVPEFPYGAMENAGAITYRDDLLLLDPATTTPEQWRRNVSVNAHELAHMWFGDLVTMAWWDDLWLNESFADWMAGKITDQVHPEYAQGLSEHQSALRVRAQDMAPSTRAIRDSTVSSAAGLANVGLVYEKGRSVLDMFEAYVGPDVFQKGVRDYLREHAWGNATASDLWRALDRASGQPVSAAMSTFTDQPGLPHVRVTPAPGGLRFTQERANLSGADQPPFRWRIPIVFRWSDGRRVHAGRVLLDQAETVVRLPAKPAWVMPNADGRGWFVWSLPEDMLLALGAARGALTTRDRVEFLGDLKALLAMGVVHGDLYLRTLEPFAADPELQVLASLLENLGEARRAFVPDSLAPAFAPWVRQTFAPTLERIGMNRKPGEPEMTGVVRGRLVSWLARWGDDARVRGFAAETARRYLADPASVEPALADPALEVAASDGDEALFQALWARFQSADVPAMRRRWLNTLGAFERPALEERALETMLDPSVRSSERLQLLRQWADKPEASLDRMRAWMTKRYAELAGKVPPPALRFMPFVMGAGCSYERYEATKAFFSAGAGRDIPGIDQTLELLRDAVGHCVGLREREGAAVRRYLETFGAK